MCGVPLPYFYDPRHEANQGTVKKIWNDEFVLILIDTQEYKISRCGSTSIEIDSRVVIQHPYCFPE